MKFILIVLTSFVFFIFAKKETPNVSIIPAKEVIMPPFDCGTPTSNVEKIVCLANTFKATLSATELAAVEIPLTAASQAKWSNFPGGVSRRNGLEYGALTAVQLSAALAVVAAASGTTPNEGYNELAQIRAADDYLAIAEPGGLFSSGEYIIAFLGTPSLTGKWMLQFGGHHYAQNITFNAGKVIGITPSHQAVEPITFTNTSGTYMPLKEEQAGLVAMLGGLTATQLATAQLATSFRDLVLGPGKDNQFPVTKVGLKCSTLTATQKALVVAAMKPWTQDPDNASGSALQTIYEKELDDTYISFSGNATLATNTDYVRIDGPSVWIELYVTGLHYHAVYRDHTRDYGASGALTSLKETFGNVVDAQFTTSAIFPNPLSISTNIPLTLNFPAKVTVRIFDLAGKEITVINKGTLTEGTHNLILNRNQNGTTLSAGMYLCKISVENRNGIFGQSKLIVVQ